MASTVNIRRWFPVAALVLALAVGARSASSGNVTSFTVNGNTSSIVQLMSGTNQKLLITCRVAYNMTPPSVHIKKVDASNRTWPLAENEDYAGDAAIPEGWRVEATNTDFLPPKTVEFTVTISPVQNADSGNYSCSLGTSAAKNVIQVVVITEPTVANMTFNGQLLTPGQSVQVTLGQEYLVTCNVSGANPYPTVNVSTSKSQLLPIQTSYYWSAQSTAVNMGYVNRSTNATVKVVFDALMLGKPVKCSGGVNYPLAVSTSFTPMNDSLVPHFQCDDKFAYPMNMMDLVITCQVLASNLTSSYVRWINSTKNNNTIVADLSRTVTFVNDTRYTLRVTPPVSDSQWYTMILTVSHAHDIRDLSSNNYQFVAINSNGQALHTVTVQQGYAAGSSQNEPSTVSYLLTLLIAATSAAVMM